MKYIIGPIFLGLSILISLSFSLEKCVLFFYGNKDIPDDLLYAYDWIVLSPENYYLKVLREKFYMKKKGKLIAYLSIGEQRVENLTPNLRKAIIGKNPKWHTKIMDIRKENYRKYLTQKAKELLKEFDGIFLDTLNSYKLALPKKEWKSYEKALKNFINGLALEFPNKLILLNRGFEIVHDLKRVDGIVVESLFKEERENIRQNIINFLRNLKAKGVQVILIEYEKDKERIRELLARAKDLGFSIYISDEKLSTFGYSNCKIVPRKVILLYDSSVYPEPQLADVHRFVQLPLEYLGFIPVLIDVNGKLPEVSPEGGYVGIVSMDLKNKSSRLTKWLIRAKEKGLKLFFLRYLPFYAHDTEALKSFGITIKNLDSVKLPRKFSVNPQFKFYEVPYTPIPLDKIVEAKGDAILKVKVDKYLHTPFVITEWGGFALENSLLNDKELWVFNPFKIFKLIFKPNFPVPDITTENGSRILTAHIDGDGFFGISEVNPSKRNAEIIRDEILKKYKIPHTVSVIEAEISQWGLHPKDSPLLEKIAKSIFLLDNVEPASHSFSHPYVWNLKTAHLRELKYGYNLPIKGYKLDFKREILGSISYINERLLNNSGKRVKLFLWTGDCNPTEEVVKLTYLAKVYNVNGGDTTINYESSFLKEISPSGINLGAYFQVYAPIQNENIYTNEWTSPYWGYVRVIQSFELTEKPLRLKPISIYYHFYSGQKQASLNALKKVYEYALSQEVIPLYLSEYAHKVLDYRQTAIIRLKDGFYIKNDGEIKTLRIPKEWGFPDIKRSKGVIGFREEKDFLYIHLDNSGRYILKFTTSYPPFWLEQANGKIVKFLKKGRGYIYEFTSYVPLKVVFKNKKCEIIFRGKTFKGKEVKLSGAKHEKIKVLCPP